MGYCIDTGKNEVKIGAIKTAMATRIHEYLMND